MRTAIATVLRALGLPITATWVESLRPVWRPTGE